MPRSLSSLWAEPVAPVEQAERLHILVGYQVEPDAAGQERHDDLVEADALFFGSYEELFVEGGGASDEDSSVRGHARIVAHTLLTGASAGASMRSMSTNAELSSRIAKMDERERCSLDLTLVWEKVNGDVETFEVNASHAWDYRLNVGFGPELQAMDHLVAAFDTPTDGDVAYYKEA